MVSDMNAIDIVRQMVTDGQVSQEVAKKYFPELKESGDDYKELLDFLKSASQTSYIDYRNKFKRWIAWLKKQGEKDKEILILKDQVESLHAAIKAVKETHRIELEK